MIFGNQLVEYVGIYMNVPQLFKSGQKGMCVTMKSTSCSFPNYFHVILLVYVFPLLSDHFKQTAWAKYHCKHTRQGIISFSFHEVDKVAKSVDFIRLQLTN